MQATAPDPSTGKTLTSNPADIFFSPPTQSLSALVRSFTAVEGIAVGLS